MMGSSTGLRFTIYDSRFTRRAGRFDGPDILAICRAFAMGGEKAPAMFPEEWPELFTIGFRNWKRVEFGAWEKRKAPFTMWRRQRLQALFDLEQEHQPVRLSLVAVLAGQTGQMKIAGSQRQAEFLSRLAAGAGVRRLARLGAEFAAARAPEAAVGFLGPFKQEHLVAVIERVEQRGNVVRQGHHLSEPAPRASGKQEAATAINESATSHTH